MKKTPAHKNSGREENLTRKGMGRPPGVPNKVTAEAKAACNELVDDLRYRAALKKRLIAGKLAPALETMLWYYAKGKPKERIEFGAHKSLAQLVEAAVNRGRPPDLQNPSQK
jgi:hypothetical protein